MLQLLQSSAPGSTGSTRILVAVGLLIVLVLGFGLFALRLRRRLLADDAADPQGPFLLDDLRAMLRRGEISQTEYEHVRRRMAAKMSGASGSLSSDGLSPPAPITRPDQDGTRRARPGFDLTGEPLPKPRTG